MRARFVFCGLLLAIAAVSIAGAQSFPFQLLAVPETGQPAGVTNGSPITFSAPLGSQTSVVFTATYEGTSQATLLSTASVSSWLIGSTEFSLTTTATPGMVLNIGDSFKFTITFHPTTASQASAQLDIPFTEPGAGGVPAQNAIQLSLTGSAPEYTLSYILQSNPNVVKITSGGTVPFGGIQLNTTAQANLNITNTGGGTGEITAITQPPTGSPFKVEGIPLLPCTLPGSCATSSNLSLLVLYTPTAVQNDTASIQITFVDGTTDTVNFSGNGTTSTFTYSYLVNGMSTTVQPGGTIV
ncbi:MAG TPA: choice-of-anchor D domain-containing protein, partial [Bryobacteraceae bacterium]